MIILFLFDRFFQTHGLVQKKNQPDNYPADCILELEIAAKHLFI